MMDRTEIDILKQHYATLNFDPPLAPPCRQEDVDAVEARFPAVKFPTLLRQYLTEISTEFSCRYYREQFHYLIKNSCGYSLATIEIPNTNLPEDPPDGWYDISFNCPDECDYGEGDGIEELICGEQLYHILPMGCGDVPGDESFLRVNPLDPFYGTVYEDTCNRPSRMSLFDFLMLALEKPHDIIYPPYEFRSTRYMEEQEKYFQKCKELLQKYPRWKK